jgi:hypothetical protein
LVVGATNNETLPTTTEDAVNGRKQMRRHAFAKLWEALAERFEGGRLR